MVNSFFKKKKKKMNNALQTSNCNEVRDQWTKQKGTKSLWEFAIRQKLLYQLIKVYSLKIALLKLLKIKNKVVIKIN